jgi:hypothetical protein
MPVRVNVSTGWPADAPLRTLIAPPPRSLPRPNGEARQLPAARSRILFKSPRQLIARAA